MSRKVIILSTLIALTFNCLAQRKKATALKHKNIDSENYYNKKSQYLIQNMNELKYDSVKVFSINCQRVDLVGDVGFKIDSSKLYYRLNATAPCVAFGKLLTKKDREDLVLVFKNSYKDVYKSDPVGPYIPTMGFAFFYKGTVCAHVEISVETDKANIEIFKDAGWSFKFNYIILGDKMRDFFLQRFEKYNLHCCY